MWYVYEYGLFWSFRACSTTFSYITYIHIHTHKHSGVWLLTDLSVHAQTKRYIYGQAEAGIDQTTKQNSLCLCICYIKWIHLIFTFVSAFLMATKIGIHGLWKKEYAFTFHVWTGRLAAEWLDSHTASEFKTTWVRVRTHARGKRLAFGTLAAATFNEVKCAALFKC